MATSDSRAQASSATTHTRLTLSVIKADIGSIGGHIAPSQALLDAVARHVAEQGTALAREQGRYGAGQERLAVLDRRFQVRGERVSNLARTG